jgi:hypothetical protein
MFELIIKNKSSKYGIDGVNYYRWDFAEVAKTNGWYSRFNDKTICLIDYVTMESRWL